MVHDGEHFRAVATHNLLPEFAELYRQPFRTSPGSPSQQLLNGERLVHIPDFLARARPDGVIPGAGYDAGLRSVLVVPLRKDTVLLGYISASRREVRPFSDKQIALLENFAAQAVIAMENARLLGELRKRTRDLQESLEYQAATSEVLNVISRSGAELATMLQTLVETGVRICNADRGVISLLHPDGLYRPIAPVGFGQEYKDLIATAAFAPGPGSVTGRVASEGRWCTSVTCWRIPSLP